SRRNTVTCRQYKMSYNSVFFLYFSDGFEFLLLTSFFVLVIFPLHFFELFSESINLVGIFLNKFITAKRIMDVIYLFHRVGLRGYLRNQSDLYQLAKSRIKRFTS